MEFFESVAHTVVDVALGLAVIALAVIALVVVGRALPIVLPAAFQFALLLGQALGYVLRLAFEFLVLAVPVVVPVVVVAITIYGTLHGARDLFAAYGSDLPALVPATLVIVMTAGVGLGGGSLGSLLASGGIAFVLGAVALAGPLEFRSLLVVGALSVTVVDHQLNRRDRDEEGKQYFHAVDQGRSGLLHDVEDDRSGDVDVAGEY